MTNPARAIVRSGMRIIIVLFSGFVSVVCLCLVILFCTLQWKTSKKWGQAISPNGTYVVTVHHRFALAASFLAGEGCSYFHLGRNNWVQKVPGAWRIVDCNVLVLHGHYAPYGIVWVNDSTLLININKPIEQAPKYPIGEMRKIYVKKMDRCRRINILYGVVGEKSYTNEVIIDPVSPEYFP